MSLMLMAYSENGYQEFILPEQDNINHSIVLNSKIFNISENVRLSFDVIEGVWRFLGVSDKLIKTKGIILGEEIIAGKVMQITVGSTNIVITVVEFAPNLGEIKKYFIDNTRKLSVGVNADNDIVCVGNNFVSRNHLTLSFDNGICVVSDQSSNGTFIKGRRIRVPEKIEYGESVNFFGVQIIWLGNIIAIGSKCGNIQCNLKEFSASNLVGEVSENKQISSKKYFRRSPRNFPKLFNEKIEIEAPPQLQKSAKRPLILTIGPSFTMAIPMTIGTVIAAMASKVNGAVTNSFMYTGIIISVLSALIGSFWAIANIKYAKKQEVQGEKIRKEKYKEYINLMEQEILKKYTYNQQSLNYIYPDTKICSSYGEMSAEMWNRNSSHEDFLYFRLGMGTIPFQCPISVPARKFTLVEDDLAKKPDEIKGKFDKLKDVPVGIDLKSKKMVGIVSNEQEKRTNILRNLVIQAASNVCYTDLKMVFLLDEHNPFELSSWLFAKWLPHSWSADKKIRYFATNEIERSEVCFSLANILRQRAEQEGGLNTKKEQKPYYIVFVSNPDLLEGEPISKYLLDSQENLGVTTVLLAEQYEQLPNNCIDVIKSDTDFCGILNTEFGDIEVVFDSVSINSAEQFARRISSVEVREIESGGDIPDALTFLEMYDVNEISKLNVSDRWRKNKTYENMRVPVGKKMGGALLNLDIHEKYHGPHGLVAGTTGSGKSETLQTYILSLAVNFSPKDVAFFLIDFKGGGMANLFANLPHTAGYISNLSGNQVHRAMVSIKSENRRRQKIFGEYGVNHIDQYTVLVKNGEATISVPHLFIIIDEFAELKREEPDFMRELISVAQVGRSLGVHLILATQKPSGTVDDNIWSNTRFKLCLRVQDRQDSNDVLHKPDAAYLTQAGRCYLQVGNDEIYELFQSGWSGATYNEDSQDARFDLASIWSNTGKSSVASTGRKMKYAEERQNKWLTFLYSISNDIAKDFKMPLKEIIEKDTFLLELYKQIKDNGYNYPNTAKNSARMVDFLSACISYQNENSDDLSVVKLAKAELKSKGKVLPETKEKNQLSAIVDYLAELYKKQFGDEKFYLWLPILPERLYFSDVSHEPVFDGVQWPNKNDTATLAVPIGIYDDPSNQTQLPLVVDMASDGNLAICGAVTSGKSTFLQTLLYTMVSKYSPEEVSIYVLDYSNHLLAPFAEVCHCGGVVFDTEPDKTEKLFVLLAQIISERKKVFQGGGYAQYVKANGLKYPYVVVVIDGYANFREKTDNKYENDILSLSREGANYGVFLVVTSGGFGSTEIQSRIADNFRMVICLEMGDKYKYSEVLRTHHFDVLPEANVKGRGLANINGNILEYQTALAFDSADDYERAEKLKNIFADMNKTWKGKSARKIPTVPENPMWEDLMEVVNDVDRTSVENQLVFGWNFKDATVQGIDLSKNYCWLISGKARTGKTNLLKVLIKSSILLNSKSYIVDFENNRLKNFAESNRIEYVYDYSTLFEMLKSLVSEFQERNAKKKELLNQGYEEEEIYSEMSKYKPIFIFIDNLNECLNAAYNPDEGIGSVSGFLENILEKGYLHNIFIIATIDYTKSSLSMGYKAFSFITSYKTGIHLGGNTSQQRIFDFSNISYAEQTKTTKVGIGLIPPNESQINTTEVIIPKIKR